MAASSSSRRLFRSKSAIAAIGIAGVLALVLLADVVIRGGWPDLLLLAPWILLGVWVTYVVFFASFVAIDDDGVSVQNLLRRHRMPWARVATIQLRWQLVFGLDDGSMISCFGGIVGGPSRVRAERRAEDRDRRTTAPPTSLELEAVLDRWEVGRDGESAGGVRHSWDWWMLAGLAGLVLWCIIAVLGST